MSPEERRLLTDLFDRVAGAAGTQRDREAEELITQKLREQPYAAYFLAQAVIIQDQALQATTNRLHELEDEIQRLESDRGPPQPQSGGFLGSLGALFGGGQPPSNTQSRDTNFQHEGRLYDDYARTSREPQPAPSPWGRDGTASPWTQQPASASGGFLRGALTTAAGVAGGVLAADAIRDMFSSHLGGTAANLGGGLGAFGNGPVEETVVNNYYGNGRNDDNSNDRDVGGGGGSSNDNDLDDADFNDDDTFV